VWTDVPSGALCSVYVWCVYVYECGMNEDEYLGSLLPSPRCWARGWLGIAPRMFVEVPAAVIVTAVLTSVDGCFMGGRYGMNGDERMDKNVCMNECTMNA